MPSNVGETGSTDVRVRRKSKTNKRKEKMVCPSSDVLSIIVAKQKVEKSIYANLALFLNPLDYSKGKIVATYPDAK